MHSHVVHSSVALPSELSLENHEEAQLVHIPGRGATISHQVQRASNVGVTVITEEVVLHIEAQHVCSALNGIIIMVLFMSSFVPSLINYYKKRSG